MSILIIGSTGTVGKAVVEQLQAKKAPIVAAVRSLEKANTTFQSGTDKVHFDYEKEESYLPALEGVEQLFFIAPPNSSSPEPLIKLLDAAKEQGVKALLFHSGRTTGDVMGKPLNVIENLVKKSDFRWTILRPGWFMQNFLSWAGMFIEKEGKIMLPAGDAKSAFVDVHDIAAASARILTEDGHHGKIYELTSEEALDHYQVAQIFLKATGKSITYHPLSELAYIELMQENGWAREAAEFTAGLYRLVKTGKEAIISKDLRNILGRAPINLEHFVAAHYTP